MAKAAWAAVAKRAGAARRSRLAEAAAAEMRGYGFAPLADYPGVAAKWPVLHEACGGEVLELPRLLAPSVIERCVLVGEKRASQAVRRTLRSNLRFVAARVAPGALPRPTPLPREPAKAPYSAAQISAYLALADAQPTVSRRMRRSALICLGAGAGLVGTDLRGLTGERVLIRSGGLLVVVAGRRPRSVPVPSGYHSGARPRPSSPDRRR